MKELYIHIGQPKTGTSALQTFCTINREALREAGIYYPIFDGDYAIREKNYAMAGNAYSMKMLACPREQFGESQIRYMEEVRKLFDEAQCVLLSAERLWGTDSWLYRNVRDFIGEKFNIKIKIIVYLRRQDERIESSWNQWIKAGTYYKSCAEYAKEARIEYDYYLHLKMISDVIGKENMIVRIYNPDSFTADRNIYKDFMSIFGLADISAFQQPQFQVNPSLGKNLVEIKRIFNAIPSSLILDDEFRKILRENVMFARSTEAITKAPAFLSYEERKEILDRYEESNRMIGQEYFGIEGSPFFELSEQCDSSEIGADIYKDIIYFFGQLLIEQKKEIELLHSQIDEFQLPENVKKESRVIVYGGDKRGRSLYHYLKRTGGCQIVGFVDKRWEKLKTIEENIEDPMIIFDRVFDYVLISVADKKSVTAIEEYLRAQGIGTERIIAVSKMM